MANQTGLKICFGGLGCSKISSRNAVGFEVVVAVGVAFDFSPPLKPSAEEVEGDLGLPTD
ncbi:hypothetical protein HNQ50_002305 [Silvimonas terrae]|uniref:Uncharacterized protein n=1 Tax=Silvimonas terrae TaxID=300266 RepID=A0A840RE19_9NEIS|nr:hypothetical protein [Silvimonas terrae]MBB5191575.1 hypothetical protein [Silvimonas terrae]